MSWTKDEEERIIFTTGGFALILNRVEEQVFLFRSKFFTDSNRETINILFDSLAICPFMDQQGICFAIALLTLRGFSHIQVWLSLTGKWSRDSTLKSYNFYWKKFILFYTEEEYQSSWDTEE
jgi:hypothetical protein